ncbi:hypothetical protein BDQ17DRAFT_1513849 [Cyathus striatus]|nr:hypothetical protein BDQ17DRAFT_1513849 [Cyathus striatus]
MDIGVKNGSMNVLKNAQTCAIVFAITVHKIVRITKRLTNMGWGDTIQNLPPRRRLENHSLVRSPRELTERIWNNIQPQLIEFLTKEKQLYIEGAEREKLKRHFYTLYEFQDCYTRSRPINTIVPPMPQFFLFEPFRSLILNTPLTLTLTVNNFKSVQAGLYKFCTEWKRNKDEELLRMVLGGNISETDLFNAEKILKHATTAFQCRYCNDEGKPGYISYPRILMHKHSRFPNAFDVDLRFPEHLCSMFDGAFKSQNITINATSNLILYNPEYHNAAIVIISATGLDPNTARVEDMDNIDPIFECVACSGSLKKKKEFMTWRAAFLK